MFDVDVCLVCGKNLHSGQAYCSERCETLDASPSMSTSSSAYSSPFLCHTNGGDVPALAPATLGTALSKHRSRNRYSTSSSSASSTSWSVSTDDEDDDASFSVDGGYSSGGDCSDSALDKPANFLAPTFTPALSYTRRPSGTNTHSTVPMLMRLSSTGSSPAHVQGGVPHSAPNNSQSPSANRRSGSSHRSRSNNENSLDEEDVSRNSTVTAKSSKRTRNRASLPSYFSLLHMGKPPRDLTGSPLQPVLNRTPSTPKLTLAIGLPHSSASSETTSAVHATPRGRRREAASDGSSSRRSENSRGRTRSRDPFTVAAQISRRSAADEASALASRATAENRRGRTTDRRHSSISPRRFLSDKPTPLRQAESAYEEELRGRLPAAQLDGVGSCREWPGYGIGRSGLMHRERTEALPGLR